MELGLVVVGGKGPSLLGRDWLEWLRLDWREIRMLNATSNRLDYLLAKHSDLFRDKLDTMKGTTAKLHVSLSVKPRFYRPRSIPYAFRSRVDHALKRLVSEGILEPVQFSEWAAPIVPVVKQDGSIRVCGDYKLTINQVAQVDTYPCPWSKTSSLRLLTESHLRNLILLTHINNSCSTTIHIHIRPSTLTDDFSDIRVYPLVWLQLLRSFNAPWSLFWGTYRTSASILTIS